MDDNNILEFLDYNKNEKLKIFLENILVNKSYSSISILNYNNDLVFNKLLAQPKNFDIFNKNVTNTLMIINPFSEGDGLPMELSNVNKATVVISNPPPYHLFVIENKIDKFKEWIRKMPLIKGMIIKTSYDICDNYFALEWERKV